uniref:Uncharacterized protein n=1 Tax=Populus trichocarpa TaxID=3694 RepID=A0A3N7G3Z5_POPTR
MPNEMPVMKIWTSNYLGDSRIVASNKLQMKGFVVRLMKMCEESDILVRLVEDEALKTWEFWCGGRRFLL